MDLNHIDVLSLGVLEMIFFLHFFLKRPINLKKFNYDKTFVLDDCKYLSKTFLNQHIFSIIIRSELELK